MKYQFEDIAILYVDDEKKSLKYFREIFEDIAEIFTAEDGQSGVEVFREHGHKIGLILSDQRMPGITGIEFLQKVRDINDKPLRVLVTAFADLQTAVSAMNDDLLYGYHTKPWDPEDLEVKIKQALDHFVLSRDRDRLLTEKAKAFQQLMVAEKAATLGTVSTGLNHHMRNSLTVIQSFFEMIPGQLAQELDGEPKDTFFWKDYYQNANNQLARLVDILSKLTEGTATLTEKGVLEEAEEIQLCELVEGAAADARSQGERPFEFNLVRDHSPLIKVNAQKVARMLQLIFQEKRWNLRENGKIEVVVSPHQIGGSDAVLLRFLDDGELLSKADRERLFDPFYVRQDRPAELGMDLMACYLTAYEHGGDIRADLSEDGRNVIEVALPVTPVPTPSRDVFQQFFEEAR